MDRKSVEKRSLQYEWSAAKQTNLYCSQETEQAQSVVCETLDLFVVRFWIYNYTSFTSLRNTFAHNTLTSIEIGDDLKLGGTKSTEAK